jgi:hypothetical protein
MVSVAEKKSYPTCLFQPFVPSKNRAEEKERGMELNRENNHGYQTI